MIFWTPEQLNIVNSNADFCLLMAYYGCGKTWCLIQRAKNLLKDQNNVIHFFLARHRLDKDESLLDYLKIQFKKTRINPTNLRTYYSFAKDEYQIIKDLKDAGVEKSHHILLDELIIANTEAFVTALKDVQSCVASAWIATRGFGRQVDPNKLRSEITLRTRFQCPELNHCLRNSKEIVNFATSLKTIRNFSCQPLGHCLEIKDENVGFFHHFGETFEDPISALKEAVNQSPQNKKSLIIVTHANLHLQHFKMAFPTLTFKDFSNRNDREHWSSSSKYQMLLFIYINNYREYIRGIEVDSMIYIYPKCKHCQSQCIFPEFVTRAKVSLIMSSFQYCEKCK